MRIQAIATLTTAAAVSFFGLQDPEKTPGLSPEETALNGNPAILAWETDAVETGKVEKYQNDGSLSNEPDPFESGPTGSFPAAAPALPAAQGADLEPIDLTEPIDLAENTEDEIIDFAAVPELIDLVKQEEAGGIDNVSEMVGPAIPGLTEADLVSAEVPALEIAETPAPEIDSPLSSEGIAEILENAEPPGLDSLAQTDAIIEPVTFEEHDLDLVESDMGDVPSLDSPLDDIAPAPAVVAAATGEGLDSPEIPTEALPSVATSVASQLVESVSEAVGAGSPEYAEGDGAEQVPTMGQEQDGGGFWLKGARLNEVYQYLARLGGMQYFHNSDLEAANFVVTGHLGDGDPIEQMEELGLMYGVTVHTKGSTVYALTNVQLAQLPTQPFQYHLNYLRPTDIEQIKTILQPVLTPGSGTVDYETKTNTLIVIDNEQKIQNIKDILAELDQPKDQIAIETRILRITSASRNRIGVDWESVLGDGLTFEGVESLNTLFNLPDSDVVTEVVTRLTDQQGRQGFTVASIGALSGLDGASTDASVSSNIPESSTKLDISGTVSEGSPLSGFASEAGWTEGYNNSNNTTQNITSTGSHLVLSPLALQATLRALNQGGLAQQESSPTMVTEDNEPGVISIIDRVPIIVTTVTETTAGQNISEEVRYRVDLDDPVNDPMTTREIGVTVSITPTLLPDNTVRMALRPRSAQIVEFVEGQTGNLFPRVNESTVDTIARVPNGHSLLIGGFYEQNEKDDTNKVPILGDVPGLGFFFKSTDKSKTNTSLVFVVTPKKYSPAIINQNDTLTRDLHERHVLPRDHAWPDRENPGFNYEQNLGWTMGNIANQYPDTPQSNPLHPDHPVNQEMWLDGQNGPVGDPGAAQAVQPVGKEKRQGFFKKLFKKRQR